MDIQLLLIIILGLLAVSLTTVCVYVIVVLREFRDTLRRANFLLESVHRATESVMNPAATMVGLASTIMEAIKTVKSIRSIADFSSKED